jgi:tetratricopeptide (TPR) repeat protein
MPDNPRIEDLRRRVQKDPASIAFAQLAEEYRRAGQHQESVDACRAGLTLHPGYLSARVTLGRALIELGQLDDAQRELGVVLKSAPENLAAIRGIADIHHKRGDLAEALQFYRTALTLARNDPDLEQTVSDLARQLAPTRGPEPKDGLSLEHLKKEISERMPAPKLASSSPAPTIAPDLSRVPADLPAARAQKAPPRAQPPDLDPDATGIHAPPALSRSKTLAGREPERELALKTIVALEHWLDAIHVARADRPA